MQQLILASGSDEDMMSLLTLLHKSSTTDLQQKIDVLKVSYWEKNVFQICLIHHRLNFLMHSKIFLLFPLIIYLEK